MAFRRVREDFFSMVMSFGLEELEGKRDRERRNRKGKETETMNSQAPIYLDTTKYILTEEGIQMLG